MERDHQLNGQNRFQGEATGQQPPQTNYPNVAVDRDQLEEALHVSESQLRAVFDYALDAVVIADDNGRYVEVNAAACKLFGLSQTALVGRSIADFAEPGFDFNQAWQDFRQAGKTTGEFRLLRPDGTVRILEYSATFGFLPNRHLSILRDITERKRIEAELQKYRDQLEKAVEERTAKLVKVNKQLQREIAKHRQTETALRKSEARFRQVIDSNMIGIMFWSADGAILEANDKFLQMVGYTQEELVAGQVGWKDITLAEHWYLDELALAEITTKGVCTPFEKEYLHKDGSRVPVLVGGAGLDQAAAHGVAFILDISDRKQAQEKLVKSEAQWRSLIQNSSDIFSILEADATTRYQSPSIKTILGYELEELIGKNALEYVHPEDYSETLEKFTWLVEHPDSILRHEYRFRRQDGSWCFLESTGSNLLAHPAVKGIIINSRDISDRRQMALTLQQQAQRERALNRFTSIIRSSLNLEHIFTTAATEISQLLQIDHVSILRFLPEGQVWLNVAEYHQHSRLASGLGMKVPDIDNLLAEQLKQLQVVRIYNTQTLKEEVNQPLAEAYPGAWLLVPLHFQGQLWGSLTLSTAGRAYNWQDSEVDLARAIADQLAIAIQQSELYQRVQHLNADLEREVKKRTAQLQLAFEFEATLKRITDKVRDSLDEDQILQTVVQELALVIGVSCCNAALYDLNKGTSTVCYEYTTTSAAISQGQVTRMADYPKIYHQLLQGQSFQFCFLQLHPVQGQVAILTSSIADDQEVLGDLWLFNQRYYAFNEQDIRLVQQVANQCAIAIRQARLYQAAQVQVEEQRKLNRLKDDFLSTVSHELRTPISNMKMAIQMLELSLQPKTSSSASAPSPADSNKVARYLQILNEECKREISLINDLLDLQRLEAQTQALALGAVELSIWLPQVMKPFQERTHNRQQQLQTDIPSNLPPLVTDPNNLERILAELLNNACKYTPPGETIIVTANLAEAQALAGDAEAEGGAVQLSVKNSGVEIPASELPHIFDKFYRVPNADPWRQGGTGLGLALVKRLSERLGGRVWVESSLGQTCFTLELPLNRSGSDP